MTEKSKIKMIALIVVVAMLIAIPLVYLTMDDSPEDTDGALLTIMGTSMSLDQLKEMDTVTGTVSFQNRFDNWKEPAEYTGVKLSDLVEDMQSTDILVVTATDGYSQRFSHRQIFPSEINWAVQGDVILAYKQGDTSVPDWEDGPMIVVLPEDERFSNADLMMTRSLVSDYDGQSSAGSLWVRDVHKIELISDAYTDTEIALTLEGITSHHYTLEEMMNMDPYTEDGTFITRTGNVVGPVTYRGVNVTYLISNIYHGTDYTLEIEASDGYTTTYTSSQVNGDVDIYDEEGNLTQEDSRLTMMLAYEEVGEDELFGGPLRIVFVSQEDQITDGFHWAREVRYIRITENGE